MSGQAPLRRCVGCGISRPKQTLIRIVCGKDGTVSIDRTSKANGRGAYLCDNPACLGLARKKKGLDRSFRRHVDEQVYAGLEAALQTT